MTQPTTWAHLPNARHIDRILAHLKAHPERWDAARSAARGAAWGAILALTAYDDCAYILDLSPGAVNIMRSAGNTKAVLMYTAVLAMQEEQSE